MYVLVIMCMLDVTGQDTCMHTIYCSGVFIPKEILTLGSGYATFQILGKNTSHFRKNSSQIYNIFF